MGSYASLRAFTAIIVLNGVFGLFAYPYFTGSTFPYVTAWLNNIAFAISALYIARNISTLLPRWRKYAAYLMWTQLPIQATIATYYFYIESASVPYDLLFAKLVLLLIYVGVWYCIISSIVNSINQKNAGSYRYNAQESLLAFCLFIILSLVVVLGFLGFPLQS